MLLSVPGKVLNRIILDRLTTTLDDSIATLDTIVEQTLEWNSSLYVNFVDFQKAFDSLDRNSLWALQYMRETHHYCPETVPTINMPISSQWLSLRTFLSRYWNQTRLPTLTIIVPNGSRLDNAQNDGSTQPRPSTDTLVPTG